MQDKVSIKAIVAAEVVARAYTGTPMAVAIEENAEQTGRSTIRAERAGRDDKRWGRRWAELEIDCHWRKKGSVMQVSVKGRRWRSRRWR